MDNLSFGNFLHRVQSTFGIWTEEAMHLNYDQNPKYLHVFPFENFDFPKSQRWIRENWTLSFYVSFAYLAFIYFGQQWMKGREAFKLKTPLIIWNVTLSVFSAVMFVRTVPELIHIWRGENGFHRTVCARDEFNVVTVFWCFVMTISKFFELGDTVFIIFRKQKLIFLHWYHHLTVMLFVAYSYDYFDSASRWFVIMNSFVHAIMYGYFAMRALGMKIHHKIPIVITTLQVLQMVIGVYVNIYSLNAKATGVECGRINKNIYSSLAMYFSFLILFVSFFKNAYFPKIKIL